MYVLPDLANLLVLKYERFDDFVIVNMCTVYFANMCEENYRWAELLKLRNNTEAVCGLVTIISSAAVEKKLSYI